MCRVKFVQYRLAKSYSAINQNCFKQVFGKFQMIFESSWDLKQFVYSLLESIFGSVKVFLYTPLPRAISI